MSASPLVFSPSKQVRMYVKDILNKPDIIPEPFEIEQSNGLKDIHKSRQQTNEKDDEIRKLREEVERLTIQSSELQQTKDLLSKENENYLKEISALKINNDKERTLLEEQIRVIVKEKYDLEIRLGSVKSSETGRTQDYSEQAMKSLQAQLEEERRINAEMGKQMEEVKRSMEDNKKILKRVALLEEKIRLTDEKYQQMKADKAAAKADSSTASIKRKKSQKRTQSVTKHPIRNRSKKSIKLSAENTPRKPEPSLRSSTSRQLQSQELTLDHASNQQTGNLSSVAGTQETVVRSVSAVQRRSSGGKSPLARYTQQRISNQDDITITSSRKLLGAKPQQPEAPKVNIRNQKDRSRNNSQDRKISSKHPNCETWKKRSRHERQPSRSPSLK